MKVVQPDGSVRDETTSPYSDLGLVIDATNMAAGSIVYSSWVDNAQWVRNFVCLVQSDQQYDLIIQRRDTSLSATFDAALAATQPAVVGGYRAHMQTGNTSLAGYGIRFGIKNSSASANTLGKVRVQLMGL